MEPGPGRGREAQGAALCPGGGLWPDPVPQLPALLQELTQRSLRLQNRIIYLDRTIRAPDDVSPAATGVGQMSELSRQHERIRMAFHAG